MPRFFLASDSRRENFSWLRAGSILIAKEMYQPFQIIFWKEILCVLFFFLFRFIIYFKNLNIFWQRIYTSSMPRMCSAMHRMIWAHFTLVNNVRYCGRSTIFNRSSSEAESNTRFWWIFKYFIIYLYDVLTFADPAFLGSAEKIRLRVREMNLVPKEQKISCKMRLIPSNWSILPKFISISFSEKNPL